MNDRFRRREVRLPAGFGPNVAQFLSWISYPIYCLHYPLARLDIFIRDHAHGSGYLLTGCRGRVFDRAGLALTRWYDEPLRAALSGPFRRDSVSRCKPLRQTKRRDCCSRSVPPGCSVRATTGHATSPLL